MNYCVYLYEGNMKDAGLRQRLTVQAAEAYCLRRGIRCEDLQILRAEKGKPRVSGVTEPVELSVTHTGDLWMALAGPAPCGIDLQRIVNCRWQEISTRKFDQAEQDYVEKNGERGFFRLWSRREAYGKLTGEGFWGQRPSLVDQSGRLLDTVGGGDLPLGYFRELELAEDLMCVICTSEPEVSLEWSS